MSVRTSQIALLTLLIVVGSTTTAPAQTPLGTAFTYQGRLASNGQPASGTYDIQFKLFDAAADGNQVGQTVCANDLTMSDGLFTVSLDFAAEARYEQRFLELAVRVDAGVRCDDETGYQPLSPRQELTASPNARFALEARSADNAILFDQQPQSFYRNAANLNAGTLSDRRLSSNVALLGDAQTFSGPKVFSAPPSFTASAEPFTVASPRLVSNLNADLLDGLDSTELAFRLPFDGTVDLEGGAALRASNTAPTGVGLDGHSRTGAGVRGRTDSPTGFAGYFEGGRNYFSGNVGIGTTLPAAKLDVRGDVKLGASGELYAAGGEENLRIVRGRVSFGGVIAVGSGFAVTHQSAGVYRIDFDPPFVGEPVVTATPYSTVQRILYVFWNSSGGYAVVTCTTPVGTPSDTQFSFIAVGSR